MCISHRTPPPPLLLPPFAGYLDDLHSFDPSTMAWTLILAASGSTSSAHRPSARYQFGSTSSLGILFVHGGWTYSNGKRFNSPGTGGRPGRDPRLNGLGRISRPFFLPPAAPLPRTSSRVLLLLRSTEQSQRQKQNDLYGPTYRLAVPATSPESALADGCNKHYRIWQSPLRLVCAEQGRAAFNSSLHATRRQIYCCPKGCRQCRVVPPVAASISCP